MTSTSTERAAGSSATLNKIARRLRDIGITVTKTGGRPPSDDEIVTAILDYFQASHHVIRFRRYRDKIGIAVPRSVLDWLKADPTRRYSVLEMEHTTDRARDRYRGTFFMSWSADEEDFVVYKEIFEPGSRFPKRYPYEFELDQG